MMEESKTKYRYQSERLNVKEIYCHNKKRRGRSRGLLSVLVEIEKARESILAKRVFVRNKSKRKEWLVLVSTDTFILEEEIIRIYWEKMEH